MIRKRKYILLGFLLMLVLKGFSQGDSLQRLDFASFLNLVKTYHPLAKQADLINQSAAATQMLARGGFDPKVFYDFRNKFYGGKNYYSLENGGFSIPTWYGIEVKAGIEQNQGALLNPENTVPNKGLLYSQVSVPILQGLLIDDRRAALKQAKLFKSFSEFDKVNAINELLYKAGKAYWDWQLAYANLKVYEQAVQLSSDRFIGVKKSYTLGDRPAIDTVEAIIQLQDRLVLMQQAMMEYKNKSLLLSNFLWMENDVPIELSDKTIPAEGLVYVANDSALNLLANKMDSLVSAHPSMKLYDFKLQQLGIEAQLKREKLKPSLNVNYNPLFSMDNTNQGYLNNYKWGLSVGFPVLLRKERGELKLTKIKIENTLYETKNKRVELVNKAKAGLNEFNNYKLQVGIYDKNVGNYERLWSSEKRLFDSGESSLFMINSREMSYLNAQLKLNELGNKCRKASLDTENAMGILYMIY